MPQNQTAHQTNQINITNTPVGNNTYIERYPQMKFVQDPKYQIHANFKPEVTEIATRLAEAVREAVWDCQRGSTYTQEAFESSMKKHLKSVPKVTAVSYGVIEKIDQFGNPWQDWKDDKESFELLQQSLLKIPLKQGTANVQYVPLETEKEADEQEEDKPWWERAWDGLKEAASDVWDTVTSDEFREKALTVGGIILGATVAAAAVIATAGAAGPAMGAVVTYLGGSATLAGAATTATTVGGYVIAGAVVTDAANTSVEVATGTNYIAKGAYKLFGNENWTEEDFLNLYGEGRDLLYMGAYGYAEFGANAMAAGYSSQKRVGGSATIKSEELVVRDSRFLDADGNIDWNIWAPGGGRVPGSIREEQTIDVGTVIDRYGNPYGKYTSPAGVPYEQRALPYVENPDVYHKYEVLKPIDNVTISQIAEAFEQPGGGIQYELPHTVNKLLKDEFLKEIK